MFCIETFTNEKKTIPFPFACTHGDFDLLHDSNLKQPVLQFFLRHSIISSCPFFVPPKRRNHALNYDAFLSGLRAATLLLAVSNFVAAAFQAIPLTNLKWQRVLVHLGMIVCDVGAAVAMALGPLISAAWFPPHQRTTATAVASLSSYVGVGLASIVGPLLVLDVGNPGNNMIGKGNDYNKIRHNMTKEQLQSLKDKIMHLMYIELGATTLLFLVVIVYKRRLL